MNLLDWPPPCRIIGLLLPAIQKVRSAGERRPRTNGRYAASPDGSALAYAALDRDGRFQIFVADLDGTDIGKVTHDPVGAVTPATPNFAANARAIFSTSEGRNTRRWSALAPVVLGELSAT